MRSTASTGSSTIIPRSRRARSSGSRVRPIALLLAAALATGATAAPPAAREMPLNLASGDVIPTGNDWIALPSIRADDGAVLDFNVISMRYRGLIEFAGAPGQPLMTPFIHVGGARKPLVNLRWSL